MSKNFFTLFFILLISTLYCQERDSVQTNNFSNSIASYLRLQNELTKEDYSRLLDSLLATEDTDYFKLRLAFTKTEYYDPISLIINDPFLEIAPKIHNNEFEEAIGLLNKFIETNYIDIKAHYWLGYLYGLLNENSKSRFHYKVFNGLISSIMNYGTGENFDNAYIIIFLNDAYTFLEVMNMQFISVEILVDNDLGYDLFTAIDKETNQKNKIYFTTAFISKK